MIPESRIKLAHNLTLFRKALKLSRKELADKSGIKLRRLENLEAGLGRANGTELVSLADILKVRISDLLSDRDGE